MRVALIRGSLVGPWELPNYLIDGVDVEVIASRGGGGDGSFPLPVRELRSPAELLGRLSPRVSGVLDLTVGSVQYLWGLEEALDGFDIAHAGELFMPMTLQACEARDRGRCRRVVASVMENIPFQPDQNRFVRRRIEQAARRVDRFVAMSRARGCTCRWGVDEERITVLPVGTDPKRFGPALDARDDGRFRVLSVCRLEHGKGVEDLAIAAGLLAKRGVDVSVSFLGRGPMRPRLERVAAAMGIEDRGRVPRLRAVAGAAGRVPASRRVRAGQRHDPQLARAARLRGARGDGERAAGAGGRLWVAAGGGRPAGEPRPPTTRPRSPMRWRCWPPIPRCERSAGRSTGSACSSATTSGRCASSCGSCTRACWPPRPSGGRARGVGPSGRGGRRWRRAAASGSAAGRRGRRSARRRCGRARRPRAATADGGRAGRAGRQPAQRHEVAGVVVLAPGGEVGDPDLAPPDSPGVLGRHGVPDPGLGGDREAPAGEAEAEAVLDVGVPQEPVGPQRAAARHASAASSRPAKGAQSASAASPHPPGGRSPRGRRRSARWGRRRRSAARGGGEQVVSAAGSATQSSSISQIQSCPAASAASMPAWKPPGAPVFACR